jgi:hypothetical protein
MTVSCGSSASYRSFEARDTIEQKTRNVILSTLSHGDKILSLSTKRSELIRAEARRCFPVIVACEIDILAAKWQIGAANKAITLPRDGTPVTVTAAANGVARTVILTDPALLAAFTGTGTSQF